MNLDELIIETIQTIKSFQDLKRKELSKSYFPTKMEVIGLVASTEKIIVKELNASIKKFSISDKIELAIKLVETNIFECQNIAYILLNKDKNTLAALNLNNLEKLARNLDNWASVDTFSVFVYGVAWRMGILSDDTVKNLLKSHDFWQRRVAVVSTVALNQKSQGGTGDVKRTLDICRLVVDDHHNMIVKALSWALRELSKRDAVAVEEFLNDFHDKLNSKVLREVSHKLFFGTKN